MLQTEAAAFEHVIVAPVVVKKNEDLDRKALRLEAGLGECNTRLDELKDAQAKALEQAKAIAKDQSVVPWWRRMTGGGQ